MKQFLFLILVWLSFTGYVYLLIAFVMLEVNPLLWGNGARIILSVWATLALYPSAYISEKFYRD